MSISLVWRGIISFPVILSNERLRETAIRQYSLSPRSYTRILKLSRTIADLSGEPTIKPQHVAEAISYKVVEETDLVSS